MGEPIKKVNLDQALRDKVENSKFTYSDEHWNKLSLELSKQNNKKSATKGIILFMQNRWLQTGLVAAVAVFATYFFMTNFSDATKIQGVSAQDPVKTETPAINNTPPSTERNTTLSQEDINDNVVPPSATNNNSNVPPTNNNIANQLTGLDQKQNENKPKLIAPVFEEKNNQKQRPTIAVNKMNSKEVELVDGEHKQNNDSRIPDNLDLAFVDTASNSNDDPKRGDFKVFALNGIGFKTGITMAPSYTGATNSYAYGTAVGLFSNFSLTPKMSLQAEVLFTQVKGHKIERVETKGETVVTDNGVTNYTFSGRHVTVTGVNYFRFPVLVKYAVGDKFNVGVGGYYSRMESPLGEDKSFTYDDVPTTTASVQGFDYTSQQVDELHTNSTSKSYGGISNGTTGISQWDAGLLVEAELKLNRWSVGARLNQGLKDITPNTVYNYNDKTVYTTNTSVEFTVGFEF